MSNLETDPPETLLGAGELCTSVEVLSPRLVPLGGLRAMTVHRTLPQRGRSLVPCVSGWGETTGTQQVPATQGENPRGLP